MTGASLCGMVRHGRSASTLKTCTRVGCARLPALAAVCGARVGQTSSSLSGPRRSRAAARVSERCGMKNFLMFCVSIKPINITCPIWCCWGSRWTVFSRRAGCCTCSPIVASPMRSGASQPVATSWISLDRSLGTDSSFCQLLSPCNSGFRVSSVNGLLGGRLRFVSLRSATNAAQYASCRSVRKRSYTAGRRDSCMRSNLLSSFRMGSASSQGVPIDNLP
mmetsp:Transcript_49210/g.123709  ORF Transcript_49210/g.123709 Transcript_49210/m.123709 type:complete len:221 (+) Transcript_49210:3594-4256(+)